MNEGILNMVGYDYIHIIDSVVRICMMLMIIFGIAYWIRSKK